MRAKQIITLCPHRMELSPVPSRFQSDVGADVRRVVESTVDEVLTGQPGLAKDAAANIAQIAAAIAVAVLALPLAQQKRLKARSADIANMIAALVRDDALAERLEIPEPSEVERTKASGLGELGRPVSSDRSSPLFSLCRMVRSS